MATQAAVHRFPAGVREHFLVRCLAGCQQRSRSLRSSLHLTAGFRVVRRMLSRQDRPMQTTAIALPAPMPGVTVSSFELHCSNCGYGVVVRVAPERCPMCQGSVWQTSTS